MDALAVSICKGFSLQKLKVRQCAAAGLYFGAFQAFMPLMGFLLGRQAEGFITDVDHWITFVMLSAIGIGMIKESCGEAEAISGSFSARKMVPSAFATSIDALAVGVTFAFLNVDIPVAVSLIGITTFLFSFAGIAAGFMFGAKYKSGAERLGGIILIGIGVKILLEHLGVI